MYSNKRILAVIPARGGSKGLPGKNILPFGGKPLLAWSVEQARASAYLDAVIVSTDSPRIAEAAQKAGAEVPFLRPKSLSGPSARSIDAIFHALDLLKGQGRDFDLVMMLQPTSPLRTAADIDGVIKFFFKKKAVSVISVCETEHSPLWAGQLARDLSMRGFVRPAIKNKPRQSLPVFYRINGAVYLASVGHLRRHEGFLSKDAKAYVMPRERSVDIDTRLDFEFAQCIASGAR